MAQATTGTNTKDLVLSALDALMKGDFEGFFAKAKTDFRIIEPSYLPHGGTYVGREDFKELGKKLSKVLSMRSVKLVSATGDSERTVLLMTGNLKANGEQRWLTEHWVVEDGLIQEIRVFWSDLAE